MVVIAAPLRIDRDGARLWTACRVAPGLSLFAREPAPL
jgi:hypothetical protein